MRIRTSLIAVAAAGILALAGDCSRCYLRLERSAETFQSCFQALKTSEVSVSPVERFVFSLILANTNTRDTDPRCVKARS